MGRTPIRFAEVRHYTTPYHVLEVGQRVVSGFASLKIDKAGTLVLMRKTLEHL